MKKHSKSESSSVPPQVEPDIAGLIIKMQQQLVFLEKKIDTLIGKASERPFEGKSHSKPFQRFDQSHRQGEVKQFNDYRERVLHKAICADCNKECEVPFRPSGDRPVYCKECFSKRRAGSSFKGNNDNRPREAAFVKESPFHKYQGGKSRRSGGRFDEKSGERKRPISKKRNRGRVKKGHTT